MGSTMAIFLRSFRFGMLALVGALGIAGCGGGDDDDDDGSGGDSGHGGSGGKGGSGGSSGTNPGLPSRLPEDEAECASATGADGCFFDECCAELAACSANAACAKTFACYRDCASEDSTCFTDCAGAAFVDGAEDFSTALSCSLLAGPSCGSGSGGSGGSAGSGGSSGSGGSAGTPSDVGPLGSATDELGWDLAVSDDPLTAELTLDADRAVAKEVTLDGGTVTATAEDGTVFELTIPEGALYGPTVITLTPLRSFEVSSLDGEAYGVQIEPDGLPLMASPTLEITRPDGQEWRVDQQLPLATTGEDNTVSLALLDPESETLRLALTHFSSYAVLFAEKGIDSTLSQSDVRNRFGGSAEERLQSAASERLGNARIRALLGSGEDISGLGIEDLFAEYEEHVLKPRIAMAGESCAAGKLAMTSLLGHERQKMLLGAESDVEFSFIELIPTVAEVCIREEYEICRDEHIITRVMPVLLGYMRQAALLGLAQEIEGVTISPLWLIQAEEYVKKCLQFELQFDSDVAFSDNDGALSMSETVTARVPFGLQASLTTLPEDALPPGAATIGALIGGSAPAPLQSTAYAVHTNEPCRTIDGEDQEDGEFNVTFMGFIPGENSPSTPGGSAEVADIGLSIAISPNLSTYDFRQQEEEEAGCGGTTVTGTEVLSWSSTLGSRFLSDVTSGENGAWVDGWKPVNSDIVATKDIMLSESDGSYTSSGPIHLIVFHTPK
jgi:hypothetical protein